MTTSNNSQVEGTSSAFYSGFQTSARRQTCPVRLKKHRIISANLATTAFSTYFPFHYLAYHLTLQESELLISSLMTTRIFTPWQNKTKNPRHFYNLNHTCSESFEAHFEVQTGAQRSGKPVLRQLDPWRWTRQFDNFSRNVGTHQSTLRNIPEDRSHLNCGGSQKSRKPIPLPHVARDNQNVFNKVWRNTEMSR